MLIRTANHGDTCNCHNKYDEELYTLKIIKFFFTVQLRC